MSNREGFDPLKSLKSLGETVGRMVEDSITAVAGAQSLPVDILETTTSVILKAGPLTGIEPEAIDVAFTTDTLTIKGETKPDDVPEGMSYLRRERKYGPFVRSVKIPRNVIPEQAVADFRDGILTITLPKVEEPEPKVINIKTVNE